jgi:hypothetical protein
MHYVLPTFHLRTTHRVPTAYQARNLVNRKLSSREAELQLRSGMSEMDRAVLKLQTFARAVFKFKKLVVQ